MDDGEVDIMIGDIYSTDGSFADGYPGERVGHLVQDPPISTTELTAPGVQSPLHQGSNWMSDPESWVGAPIVPAGVLS